MQQRQPPWIEASACSSNTVLPMEARRVLIWRSGRYLLNDVSISVAARSGITVLLGPNGAGKSLLVRVLADLVRPDQGIVTWAGSQPDRQRSNRIGFVFQKPVLLQRSVEANISYALAVSGTPRAARARRVAAALATARLTHLAGQPAWLLSGGEQQKLALARARACHPEMLILDEPSSNLDPASTAAIEQALVNERDAGTSILFITHDIAQARRLADRVILMNKGSIIETNGAAIFFACPQTTEARTFLKGDLLL